MPGIHHDLIVEILLVLPVLSLLRFRLVSKQWCALIDSSTFGESHSKKAPKKNSVMMACNYLGAYYADFNSLWDGRRCRQLSPATIYPRPYILNEIRYPRRECAHHNFRDILGPCNGVFCIVSMDHGVFLWNPFTRKHFNIALPPHQPPKSEPCSYWGFGYDSNLDDYKLVLISRLTYYGVRGLGQFVVWVHSVKLGIWNKIGDMPYVLPNDTSPALFVGGALHWRAKGSDPDDPICMIVALDVASLKWRLVSPPEYTEGYTKRSLWTVIVDGYLCVYSIDYLTQVFDFWVMKEYGVEESWSRMITSAIYPGFVKEPLGFVDNGKKLLLNCGDFLLAYDFGSRSFEVVNDKFSPGGGARSVYTPTLLLPLGKGACAKKIKEEPEG